MSYLAKIQRSIDFIEDHLQEDLSLVQVAKVVAFSPYHFHYVFGTTVGESFKDYIRKRRLTEAAHVLRRTDRGILDIAIDYGFESQESFTRAFKKMFRINPGAYRKAQRIPRYFEKKKISLNELEHRMKGIVLKQKTVNLPEFYVVGLEYIGTNENLGNITKTWDQFSQRINEVSNRIDPGISFGYCYSTPEMVQEEKMRYVASVKVKDLSSIPEGMVGVKIPAQSYSVFTHKGPIDKIKESYNYIYSAWFPKSGMEPADGPDFEFYDNRFEFGAESSELDIYVPVFAS